ncbi:MAG TPA: hypothetical protein VGO57_02720 [Verrucomicrobiae bacterium]
MIILAGAILTAVSGRATTVFNVASYGVVGDGTNDDYPALLSACEALQSNQGGELYFPPNLTCRIATAGVGGIAFSNLSNVTILMDQNSVLLMDNLVSGLAVSHGIFIQGPCTNINLIGVHVKYATMSVSRQGWSPIYLLGANIYDGTYFQRGSSNGAENTAALEAGAIKNVLMQNVTVENSPSGMVGIVGVDGITIDHFTGINSWADGLYHVNFRNSHLNDITLINCGDDAISMASYESDTNNANITNSFHGEDSVIANVTITGYWPTNGDSYQPAGGLAFLGVRDVSVSDVQINNRYRGIRFEAGFENFQSNPAYNFNFLANRGLSISDVGISNCTQIIAIGNDAITINNDPKWWQSDVHLSDLQAYGGDTTATIYGENGGDYPLMDGFTFKGFSASGYSQPYGTFQNFINCKFENMQFDGNVNFNGFTGYGGDPLATNAFNGGAYPSQNSKILNLKCQSVTFLGLKDCTLDSIVSYGAPQDGITLTSCGNVQFGSLTVNNANRTAWQYAAGILIDSYNKNITGQLIKFNQDSQTIPNSLSLGSTYSNRINQVVINTGLNTGSNLAWDQMWNSSQSQIGAIHWINTGVTTPAWQSQIFTP